MKKNKGKLLLLVLLVGFFGILFFQYQDFFKMEYETNKVPFVVDPARIAIVMSYTKNIESYAKYAEKINRRYAKENGYTIVVNHGRFMEKEYERTPHWDKVSMILHYLPKYDYVVWIDSDAIFSNPSRKIEPYIFKANGANIIIGKDMYTREQDSVNTGVIIVKNSPWSLQFFEKYYNDPVCRKYYYLLYHEQSCLEIFENANYMDLKNNIYKFSSKEFNTFNGMQGLVFHLAGFTTAYREHVFHDLDQLFQEKDLRH